MQPFFLEYVPILNSSIAAPTLMGWGLRLLVAGAVVVVGVVIVKFLQGLLQEGLKKIRTAKVFKQSPIGEYTKDAELASSIEKFISEVVFWLLMLVVFDAAANILGLVWLSSLFDQVLSFLPNLFSAGVIIVFGALLASLLESIVKNSIKPFDVRLARLSGKSAGYITMSLALLIAVSELGIARDFILILFIGMVSAIALAIGLGLGLGSQHFVKDVLERWQQRWQDRSK